MHICNFMDEERPSFVINSTGRYIFLRHNEEYIVPDTFQHQKFNQFWFYIRNIAQCFVVVPKPSGSCYHFLSLHQRKNCVISWPSHVFHQNLVSDILRQIRLHQLGCITSLRSIAAWSRTNTCCTTYSHFHQHPAFCEFSPWILIRIRGFLATIIVLALLKH